MKVKIIKSSHWHKGMVGKIVNTNEADQHGVVYVDEPGATYHGNGLWARDYEVFTGDIFQQPMKFRTPTPADSERIQRALFGLGASWQYGGNAVPKYTGSKFLYLEVNGCLTHGQDETTFNGHDNTEYVIDGNGTITLPTPSTKFATVDGVKYELPGWAKFVTRDGEGMSVWAWEKEPAWREARCGGNMGYYSKEGSEGKHHTVSPYVEPKPAGSLILEVA